MHWYSSIKSILFRDRRSSGNRTARQHRHDIPKLPPLPQPALVGATLDRRAIRLRRD